MKRRCKCSRQARRKPIELLSIATNSPAIKPPNAAKLHEGAVRRNKGGFVVLAKIGNGLEVGFEPVDQPNHFDVALALSFEPPRRADPLEK